MLILTLNYLRRFKKNGILDEKTNEHREFRQDRTISEGEIRPVNQVPGMYSTYLY